jgi:RHS repeat-associated protein
MKLTNLICAFVLAATASTFATEAGPKKMNGKLEIVEANPADVFYTGKPYEGDLGGYVFKYRTYSPEINRWTTPDPSGFPDGANNRVYAPVPTQELDNTGLWKLKLNSSESHYTETGESTFKDSVGENREMDVMASVSVSSENTDENGYFDSGTITGYGRSMFIRSEYNPPSQLVTVDTSADLAISVDSNGQISITDDGGQYVATDSSGLSIAISMNANINGRKATVTVYADGIYLGSGITGAQFTLGPVGAGLNWSGGGRGECVIHTKTLEFEVVE